MPRAAVAGFDLAHSIGNVPLALHADEADFAVWCSYKYLNAGPGAVGGAFVHERHLQRKDLPRLTGWWGHDPQTRFQMPPAFQPATGVAAWAISNPPIFSTAPLRASLPLFVEAGIAALRSQVHRADQLPRGDAHGARRRSPASGHARPIRSSVAVSCRCGLKRGAEHGRQVFQALSARGIVSTGANRTSSASHRCRSTTASRTCCAAPGTWRKSCAAISLTANDASFTIIGAGPVGALMA